MQERVPLTDAEINRDLLRSINENHLWFWLLIGALGSVVLVGFGAAAYMIYMGLGVTGLNRPVMWGFFITNFVFWIGISHAGVMLSAILRLTQAEWRRPATTGGSKSGTAAVEGGAASECMPTVVSRL